MWCNSPGLHIWSKDKEFQVKYHRGWLPCLYQFLSCPNVFNEKANMLFRSCLDLERCCWDVIYMQAHFPGRTSSSDTHNTTRLAFPVALILKTSKIHSSAIVHFNNYVHNKFAENDLWNIMYLCTKTKLFRDNVSSFQKSTEQEIVLFKVETIPLFSVTPIQG